MLPQYYVSEFNRPGRVASKADITIPSGRTFTHRKLDNGAWEAIPTSGADEMTSAEWQEYCVVLRQRSRRKV